MRLETKHTQHRTVDLSESEVTEGANNAQSRGNLHENTPEELGFIVCTRSYDKTWVCV